MFMFYVPKTILFATCFWLLTSCDAQKEDQKKKASPIFIAGRTPPGQFEYPKINGYYRPSEAAEICEKDAQCGGFTFKGTALKIGSLAKKKYEVYFFHYVPRNIFDRKQQQYYHWTSYIVQSRKYTVLTNHQGTSNSAICLQKTRHFWENKFSLSPFSIHSDYSAVQMELKGHHWTAFKDFDFKDVIKSNTSEYQVFLNLKSRAGQLKHSFPKVNRCCKKPPPHFGYDQIDQVPRISCKISKSKFLKKYVEKRQAVLLTGCQQNWKASNWTFEGILKKYPDFWSTTYKTFSMSEPNLDILSSEIVLDLVNNGSFVKLFNKIYKTTDTDEQVEYIAKKLAMQSDYQHPNPLPEDLFLKYGIPSEQGYFILGTKGTGTELHLDPDVTDAWNGVIAGKKWWAYLPKDFYEAKEQWTCDQTCSHFDKIDLFNAAIWLYNILPQLRNRTFYGDGVKTFLQVPGEVIYMPHFVEHLVYNTEFTLAVGENLLFASAMEETVASMQAELKKDLFLRIEEADLLERMKAVEAQTRRHKLLDSTKFGTTINENPDTK